MPKQHPRWQKSYHGKSSSKNWNALNKQRKELFDHQDEVDELREALIGRLETKLNQKTEVEDLFTIRWRL